MPWRRFHVCTLLLTLPLALVLTEIRQYSRNTLAENRRWVSAKPLMQIPLMGARQYLATRNALAGNRLDLRAWHGYNEIYFHEPVRLGSLDLEVRLADDAHLSLILGRTEEGFEGLRLSRHPRFPSMAFRAGRSGRFSEQERLDLPPIRSGWHRLAVESGDDGWVARLDGETLAQRDGGRLAEGLIGFRSGFSRVEIDDVRIADADGQRRVRERFRSTHGYWKRLATSTLTVWAGMLGVAWIAARRRDRGGAAPAHWVALLTLVALVASLLYYGFDRALWSRSYIYQERNPNAPAPPALLVSLESWRQALFGRLSVESIHLPVDEAARRVTRWDLSGSFVWPGPNRFNRYAAYTSVEPGQPLYLAPERLASLDRDVEAHLVAFVGGSQTVGVGAEVVGDALVGRFHRALSAAPGFLPDTPDLWAFNLAVAGGRTPQLLGYYEHTWLDLEPDLVVINVSFNDRDLSRFETALRRFVELDRQRGIPTLLVVEPMSPDKDDPGVRERQAVVREVGRTERVPVLDLEAYLASPAVYDSGFLWWDQIHLTSYGQDLAGRWLAERVEPHLPSEARGPSEGRGPSDSRGRKGRASRSSEHR